MAIEEDAGMGIPEWVVTFGDMMSLLLTFFIMLVSLSEIKEEEKYQAMVESMQRVFGYDTSQLSTIPGSSKPRNAMIARLAAAGRAKRLDVMQGGNPVRSTSGDDSKVRKMREAQATGIGTTIYFQEDSIELTDDHRRALMEVKLEIGGKPQKIEIRGHTWGRPLPPNSDFRDHLDIGFERARNVYDFMVGEMGIAEERIRLSTAAPHEPLYLSPDPELQRKNPRVEVFLVNETVHDLAGTQEEQALRFKEESPQ